MEQTLQLCNAIYAGRLKRKRQRYGDTLFINGAIVKMVPAS
jgi:hypothetical protein